MLSHLVIDMAGAAKKPAKKAVQTVKHKELKNPLIARGIRKFSNAQVMRRTGSWKFVKDPVELAKAFQTPKKVERKTIVKQIGGDKNGKERVILVKKPRKFYSTEDSLKPPKTSRKRVYRAARKSITPGTVLILLAGRHRGRRVVYLKQLESGLLLVTGPYKLNSCPLRRIHQNFVIATSTKLDITSVKLSEQLKDQLFAKPKMPRSKGNTARGGDLFEQRKVDFIPSEERRKLQVEVDSQLLEVIGKNPDAEVLKQYLKKPFALNSRMYPHALKF
ncbi:60S ribosomal protein L6-B-like isoform X1 [Varroa jacobsoni]|uniref:60S ribosomal protein L6 n=2 Tax=Varroa destructor TaxID=109461 RepID=A0A7M7MIS0_VARDE|nr:60S ribosomal protein L6-B-like isoform X1 [Varroa destructor]XP_022706686.1 60S ribosomal protein L6-B-like isoform X1 [Varroa jacobsoni]